MGNNESYLSWRLCRATKKTEGLPEDSRCSAKDFNQASARCQSEAVLFK